MKPNQFVFRGQTYTYCDGPLARRVEVPIAWAWVKACYAHNDRVLEVGNVLTGYVDDVRHPILDKYEVGPERINEDAVWYRPAWRHDRIVCISTIEHIGESPIDAPENRMFKPLAAVYNLMLHGLLPGGKMLLTFPWRRRPGVDGMLEKLSWKWVGALERITEDSWEEVEAPTAKELAHRLARVRYNRPFRKANAVVVGELVRP